jgi:hypothetical protein
LINLGQRDELCSDWRIYPLAPPAKCDLLHKY